MSREVSVKDGASVATETASLEKPPIRPDSPNTEWTPSIHELLVMIVASVLSLMVALDACIIVTALNAIVVNLKSSATQGFWVGTAYLLASAVAMPLMASISDVFGRRPCLLASVLFFAVGTVLCCIARSIAIVLVGRSLQGVGGGGIVVLSLVVFTDIVPLRFRPEWYGTVLGSWALGSCLGPIIGGEIAQHTSWRWIFYLMLPLCLVGGLPLPWLVVLRNPPGTISEKLQRVDWLGGMLFTCSAALLLISISWAGMQYPCDVPGTLIPLCLSIVGFICTFCFEKYVATRPFLHPSLFCGASPIATYACGAIQGLIICGQLYYIPFYFLAVKGYTPAQTGIAILPVMLTLVPASIVTGILVTRTRNYRYPIWAGWLLTTIASGLTLLWNVATPVATWVPTLVILGFGHGAILNAQNFATQAMCKPGEQGLAATMYGFLRQVGMALGVALCGSAFLTAMSRKLQSLGLPVDIAASSEGDVGLLKSPSQDETFQLQVLDAYVSGFQSVSILYVALSGAALLLSLAIKRSEMDRKPSGHISALVREVEQVGGAAA